MWTTDGVDWYLRGGLRTVGEKVNGRYAQGHDVIRHGCEIEYPFPKVVRRVVLVRCSAAEAALARSEG